MPITYDPHLESVEASLIHACTLARALKKRYRTAGTIPKSDVRKLQALIQDALNVAIEASNNLNLSGR